MLKTLVCLLAILGLAATADASWKWTGYAGNNLWSDGSNWDNLTPPPSNESWVVNKVGFPIGNHVILVDQNTSTQTGEFVTTTGYKCSMTVQSGVTMNMSTLSTGTYGQAVDIVVEAGANFNVNVGDATLNIGIDERTTVYGNLLADYIYVNNQYAALDIYGYAETWGVTRIASDPGCGVFVRDGATFKVTRAAKPPTYNGGYNGWDKKLGKVFIDIGGTALFAFDCQTDYLNYVAAGETGGGWHVSYGGGYTTIKLVKALWPDADDDGDVDQDDFAQFQACYSGGEVYPTEPENCDDFDSDGSGKIDATDFAAFTACATGPGIPVNTSTAPACAALIMATWEANDGHLGHLCGAAQDTDDWRCTTVLEPCWMSYGPNIVMEPGDYVARIHLRIDDISGNDDDICNIDVYSTQGGLLAGPITLKRSDFAQSGVYQPFDISFNNPGMGYLGEFRVYYLSNAQLDLDKVQMLRQ